LFDERAQLIQVGGPHGAEEGLDGAEGGVVGLIPAVVAVPVTKVISARTNV
jgi:hypothetical protein